MPETDATKLWVRLDRVIEWGHVRREYDLAHPKGEHEAGEFSNRPAFLDHLLPMEPRCLTP